MLDTVDDLRYRMAGLPSSQMLEQLASDLHARTDRITHELDSTAEKLAHDLRQKADRAEIDRLQRFLRMLFPRQALIHTDICVLVQPP